MDLTHLPYLDVLTPDTQGSDPGSHEAWSCAFAPDESCFAWSYGSPVVYVASWHQYKQKTTCAEEEKRLRSIEPKSFCQSINCYDPVLSISIGWTSRASRTCHWSGIDLASSLLLAAGLANGRVRVMALSSGRLLHELMDHQDQVRAVAFAPDRTGRLVSGSKDRNLKVWDICEDGNRTKTLVTDKIVSTCAWSPDAKMLASAGEGKKVTLWDMVHYKEITKLFGHLHDIVSCEFSKDGAILATASWDTRVILWDPHACVQIAVLGHLFPTPRLIYAGGYNETWVRSVSLSRDGRHIASIADDRKHFS